MTSESRDYFRTGDERVLRFEGWSGTPVTWTLILVQTVLWLVYAGTVNRIAPGGTVHEVFRNGLSLTANRVLEGRVWQVATYFFLHGPSAILDLVYSLAFLFFFGRELERLIGGRAYLRLYVLGGLVAGALAIPWLYFVGWPTWPVATAAGAVYAVTIGYLLRRPNAIVIFGVPAWGFAVFLVLFHLAMLAVMRMGEVYSFFNLAGAGFAWIHLRGAERWERTWAGLTAGIRRRREERAAETESDRRRRVDALLEKIETKGIAALSEREKAFLQKASKEFR